MISDLYIGVLLLQALRVLSCDYKMENETRMVVCDLGNPMVAGANVRENQMHLLIFIWWNFKGEQMEICTITRMCPNKQHINQIIYLDKKLLV